MSAGILELDGSLGEGGGQILRSSLTLSLLTGKPFHLMNIRAGRSKPGLQPQHLTSVQAAAAIGRAGVQGDTLGSQELKFAPGRVDAGAYSFHVGTAGSTGLVLQTIALPLALRGSRPSEVIINGGTHVKASPAFHFLSTTWRAYLERLSLTLRLEMRLAGFYPRGGGVIRAEIEQAQAVRPLRLDAATERVELQVSGFAAVAGLPEHIAERMIARVVTRLKKQGLPCELAVEQWHGGPGAGIALVLHGPPVPTLFFGLGERGKPAERVADQAVDELLAHVAAAPTAVDPHIADQLLLPLAFAEGSSEYAVSCVTQHLLTNVEVVRRFVDREILCEGAEGEIGRVLIR